LECSLKNVCLAFNPSASVQLITRLLAVAGTHKACLDILQLASYDE